MVISLGYNQSFFSNEDLTIDFCFKSNIADVHRSMSEYADHENYIFASNKNQIFVEIVNLDVFR